MFFARRRPSRTHIALAEEWPQSGPRVVSSASQVEGQSTRQQLAPTPTEPLGQRPLGGSVVEASSSTSE